MLLAIDIGNTNISLGVFKGSRLIRRYSIPTNAANYFSGLARIFSRDKIDDAIICSVVPDSTKILAKCLNKLSGKKPIIIGKDILVPIKNLYRYPRQVGQDRLVNAYAGVMLYGAPLILVDFGTAITFDVISKDREYLGGMILPGLEISLDALSKRTALLPKVKLRRPGEFIGRETKESILSGIVFGFTSLADDLSQRIKNQIGKEAKFVGTGGNIGLLSKYCRKIDRIEKALTLKGLYLIYKKQKNS